ncbi:MAG TPA: hypothetical protein VHZ76_07270 [Gammaproteobacteria bacterium]|nr:hypothetical protein [Gammaproteobacteria bacterium]
MPQVIFRRCLATAIQFCFGVDKYEYLAFVAAAKNYLRQVLACRNGTVIAIAADWHNC